MTVGPKELHRVCVTAIIYNKEGKYLITKRSAKQKFMASRWHVPGGGISMDDYVNLPKSTPNDPQWYNVMEVALKREVREEVNLEIGKAEYLLDLAFVRHDGVPAICLSYFAPYSSGDVVLSHEDEDFAWVTFEEAKKYNLIEGIIDEIGMVDKIIKK